METPPGLTRKSRLATLCAALNEAGVHYVVAGANAGILHGYVRATRDIDVLIEPTESNAARALEALGKLGFLLVRDLDPAAVAARPVTVVGDLWTVDILTRAWNVLYEEAASEARQFEVEGVRVPALSLRHLIASKRTGRLQDAADIDELERLPEARG